MFEFDELEAALPPEAYVVTGAGHYEVNGIYSETTTEYNDVPIFRHSVLSDQLLSRETHGGHFGWLIGSSRRPLYGIKSDDLTCPSRGWRVFKGEQPAPLVEGFSSLADAAQRLSEIWLQDAAEFVSRGKFTHAAEVYKQILGISILSDVKKAQFHALRAKTFRQMAESKKQVSAGQSSAGDEMMVDGAEGADDPLHGLAAEWSIEEADAALKLDAKCFLAAWEGAIAAKHIGWWSKGRLLAKKAMEAVPRGPEHRAQRETASTLFLLMAEEEEAEKQRKVKELQKQKQLAAAGNDRALAVEAEWARGVLTQLNEALKSEDFRRPHHQLWKMISPGTLKSDADELFAEIRKLVWKKWEPVTSQHDYQAKDPVSRKRFCARIVDVINGGTFPELKTAVREIEDRICLDWPEIPEAIDYPSYDETWAWTRRPDGSYGAWTST